MSNRRLSESARIVIEPDYIGCTYFVVSAGSDVLLQDGYKAWHFGHDNGSLDDLEEFFQGIADNIPGNQNRVVILNPTVTKYNDIYDFLCDVEQEIGWAPTLEALAQVAGKTVEYRNGEGNDPLDDGDTCWAFAVINK